MSTSRLVLLTTIVVGLGCGTTLVWAAATQTDLGQLVAGFLGAGVGQLMLLLKSPLGKGS